MNVAAIKFLATEDGIGCRTALFVSGCRHHCKGCFQPQTWDFNYGKPFTKETEDEIIESLKPNYVNGLTLLGGEPFEIENQHILRPFIKRVKDIYPEKSIWAYSGYTFEELINNNSNCHSNDTIPLLRMIDVLIDGEFILAEKNLMLPFRGSNNQRILNVPESLKENKAVLSIYHDRQN